MTEQNKPGSKTAEENEPGANAGPSENDGPHRADEDAAEASPAADEVSAGSGSEAGEAPAASSGSEESSADEETAAGDGEDNGGTGRAIALVAWLALLIALAAGGLSGYRWWQERSAGNETAGLASTLEAVEADAAENADALSTLGERLSSVQESLQQSVQQVQQKLQQAQQQARQAQQSADQAADQAADADELSRLQREFRESRDIVESLPGRMQNLEESMASLQGISAGARDAWLTAEAEYYMQLANAQAQLAGNAELASFALELADRRIRELGDPVYTPVRRELKKEITSLEAVQDVDTEGVALTLSSLADVVQSLPLDEDVAPADRPRSGIDGELSGVQRAWAAVKSAFSDMVSVRRTDEQLEPLLSPEAQYFLRTNIALQLQTARLALLQGEGAIFRQSLQDARSWLERYFDGDSKAVSGALDTVTELIDSPVSAELPDISASLRLFRQQQAVAEGAE